MTTPAEGQPTPGDHSGEPSGDLPGGALPTFGWRPATAKAFAPFAARNLRPARVVSADRIGWTVIDDSGAPRHALAAGKLRQASRQGGLIPVVGDWVGVRDRAGTDIIHAVAPRTTTFSRRQGRTDSQQVLVANVDTAFLVVALPHDLNPRRLERYLAMTWEGGVVPVVVLSKADLAPDLDGFVAEVAATAPGVPVHAVSAVTGQGVDELRAYFPPDRTVALLGSSGVGKSTMTNLLLGRDAMAVGEVRADGKGRHTTTRRELFPVPGGGLIADTPGLRTVLLWDSADGIADAFEDVQAFAEQCRFVDCRHENEPGCAVRAAVADGRLPAARLEAYRKLRSELQHADDHLDPRALSERRRQERLANKALRGLYKQRGR